MVEMRQPVLFQHSTFNIRLGGEMPIELKMPKLGESVTEGTVGRWLKQVGERVTLYEPLLEVTTDKVDTEIPAPVDGVLLEVRVPEGETVGIGTVLALLGAEGDTEEATGNR